MTFNISNKLKSNSNKRLVSNFISLSFLQGANYLLPLITFPYLVRTLGVDGFGVLAFSTIIVAYFNIIVDYGFNLSATKEIAAHRENKRKIAEIYSAVLCIKLFLTLISFVVFSLIILSFDIFGADRLVYFLAFGTVIGQALFPVWLFQGMERMTYITFLNILSKVIFAISIFIFVKETSDVYKVPLINSIGMTISGFLSLYIIRNKFNIEVTWKSLNIQKEYFIEGWSIFISRIFVNLYTTTNTLLLGIFTNTTVIGYYSIAEKIVNAVSGLFSPANQALYPFLAKIYADKKIDKFQRLIKSVSLVYIFFSMSLFVTFCLFGDFIIELITGSKNRDISQIYYILVVSIITSPFGAFYTQILLIRKQNRDFNKIVRNTFLFSIALSPMLIYLYEGIGLSISVVLSQVFVISLCINAIKKENII